MKKCKKPALTLALLLIILASFTLGAAASSTLKEITANLNYGITIKYDGEAQILTDATGSRIYPISYNGSTYLPIRAVSDMLGIAVDWDQATQTVLLGAQVDGVDLIETYKPYTKYGGPNRYIYDWTLFAQSSDGKTETVGGVTIDHWLLLHSMKYGGGGGGEEQIVCSFNIGGQYSTLTFQAYSSEDTTLTVKGDNDSVLGEFSLIGGQTPQTLSVDLHNTTQLTFVRAKATDTSTEVVYPAIDTYIFDAILK